MKTLGCMLWRSRHKKNDVEKNPSSLTDSSDHQMHMDPVSLACPLVSPADPAQVVERGGCASHGGRVVEVSSASGGGRKPKNGGEGNIHQYVKKKQQSKFGSAPW